MTPPDIIQTILKDSNYHPILFSGAEIGLLCILCGTEMGSFQVSSCHP